MGLIGESSIELGVEIYKGDKLDSLLEVSEADYDVCPVCGSDNIEFGSPDAESCFIYRVHVCQKCGSQWEERYDLVRVTIENNKED